MASNVTFVLDSTKCFLQQWFDEDLTDIQFTLCDICYINKRILLFMLYKANRVIRILKKGCRQMVVKFMKDNHTVYSYSMNITSLNNSTNSDNSDNSDNSNHDPKYYTQRVLYCNGGCRDITSMHRMLHDLRYIPRIYNAHTFLDLIYAKNITRLVRWVKEFVLTRYINIIFVYPYISALAEFNDKLSIVIPKEPFTRIEMQRWFEIATRLSILRNSNVVQVDTKLIIHEEERRRLLYMYILGLVVSRKCKIKTKDYSREIRSIRYRIYMYDIYARYIASTVV